MNRNEKFLDDEGCETNWGARYKRQPAGITLSDKKIPVDVNNDFIADYYKADIVSAQDYYPFGMLMPERQYHSSLYGFGYQGSLKDSEISGKGSSYSTTFRLLEPRLGRWLSTDPKGNAFESPYMSMGDNPIWRNDVLGNKWKTKADKDEANNLKQNFKNGIKSLNKDISKNKMKLQKLREHYFKTGNLNESNKANYARNQAKINEDKSGIAVLKSGINKIDALAANKNVDYTFQEKNNFNLSTLGFNRIELHESVSMNGGKTIFTIPFAASNPTATQAHGIVHAWQFNQGILKPNGGKNTTSSFSGSHVKAEIQAYQLEYFINSNALPNHIGLTFQGINKNWLGGIKNGSGRLVYPFASK